MGGKDGIQQGLRGFWAVEWEILNYILKTSLLLLIWEKSNKDKVKAKTPVRSLLWWKGRDDIDLDHHNDSDGKKQLDLGFVLEVESLLMNW